MGAGFKPATQLDTPRKEEGRRKVQSVSPNNPADLGGQGKSEEYSPRTPSAECSSASLNQVAQVELQIGQCGNCYPRQVLGTELMSVALGFGLPVDI